MKNETIARCLLSGCLLAAGMEKSIAASGTILEKPNHTAAIANRNQTNEHTFDYSGETAVKPINSLIIAAYGKDAKNTITVKGNPSVGEKDLKDANGEASLKDARGEVLKEPAHWTIQKEKPAGYVSSGRYKLQSSVANAGILLADQNYEGKNNITLENVSVKVINSGHAIHANDTLTDPHGMSDTTLTFKGNNYLYTDGSKVTDKAELNGIVLLKNNKNISSKETKNHTKIESEAGSNLNIYVKSGTSKGRGIAVTQYKDVIISTSGPRKTVINQTEMDFRGAVSIKVDRGDKENAENYGVYVGNLPKKSSRSEDVPDDSYNRVTFHSDVKIDVQPVLDENGKQKSIGDALNVDGKNSRVDIKGDGTVQIDGDIHVLNGGVINLNLKNKNSYLNGEAHIGKQRYTGDPDDPDNPPGGQPLFDEDRKNSASSINMTMKDGARWNVQNTSKINGLDISNGAEVSFSDGGRNVNVSVENLKGDGTFNMQGDIMKGTADRLIVRDSSEGHHKVNYKDDGSAPTKGDEHLLLVEFKTPDKSKVKGDFALKTGTTDQGAYEFTLTDPSGSKIVNIPAGKDYYLNPTGRLSTGAQGAVILGDIIYQSNLALTESLHQRLGEIHFNKNITKQSQIWAKNIDGQYVSKGSIKVSGYTNNYLGLKIGYDWINARGNWINYNGLSFGYISSAAKSQTYPGKIKLNGTELGLYSSWLNKENDWYFDFFTKAISYSGGYDLVSPSKKSVKSPTIRTFTYILSAETGKRINLSETAERVIYLQPEAQLSYHATKGYDFTVSNKLMVETEKVRSLVGRIGFRAGLDYFNEKEIHPYIKLMYRREFLGEMKYTFNKVAVEKILNKGNWLEYGLGVSYMNKAKNTQVYFEAQSSTIHRFKQNWQAHIGIRYLF